MKALLYCQRYESAAQQSKELLPGTDRLYLEAELAWRSGHLASSLTFLQESEQAKKVGSKCEALHRFVSRLVSLEEASQKAMEEGEHTALL